MIKSIIVTVFYINKIHYVSFIKTENYNTKKKKANFINENYTKIHESEKTIKLMIKFTCTKEKREVQVMVDKFCSFLINKMRKEMPDIDDERAEIIAYGLQLIIGEIPKIFITLAIAYILGVLKLTLITVLVLTPYRAASGGVHLKTHIGCIVSTTLYYCGVAILAKYLIITGFIKYILALAVWIFGMIMVKLYAPADTENVPILRKSERKQKQILSYITLTIGLIVAVSIKNSEISNILLFGNLIQSMMITRLAYRLTGSKYGYEVYENASTN